MKPAERDQLLARLDERSLNTWHTVEKIEQHQVIQNGTVADLVSRVATIEGTGIGLRMKISGVVAVLGFIASQVLLWLRQAPPM
ncbi:hypothetical protein LCGC14_2320590 [marine sediment metagenome]|uniref:Uncharacterized protein n=1 Tax=marine sediment metagenome TaxID=412755 RepID=A0A0F9FCS5_9ZZZZ